jgi:hypothetical protein
MPLLASFSIQSTSSLLYYYVDIYCKVTSYIVTPRQVYYSLVENLEAIWRECLLR